MGLFNKKNKDTASSSGGNSHLKISMTKDGAEYTFLLEGRLDTITSPDLESKINEVMRQLRYQRSDLLCGVRTRDEDALPVDTLTTIRMNVDDFDEAYQMLISRGFKNYYGDQAVNTKTSKSAIMISPTGFVINLIHHIKK